MTIEAVRADQELEPFYAAMTVEDLHSYWTRKNTTSIDGYPTHVDAAPSHKNRENADWLSL